MQSMSLELCTAPVRIGRNGSVQERITVVHCIVFKWLKICKRWILKCPMLQKFPAYWIHCLLWTSSPNFLLPNCRRGWLCKGYKCCLTERCFTLSKSTMNNITSSGHGRRICSNHMHAKAQILIRTSEVPAQCWTTRPSVASAFQKATQITLVFKNTNAGSFDLLCTESHAVLKKHNYMQSEP